MKAVNSDGDSASAVAPCLANSSRTSGDCSALTISVCTFFTMAAGVFAGAATPHHSVLSNPGTVSATAGNSASNGSRFAPVVAITLILPAFQWAITVTGDVMM